jgi:hypothetical protein
MEALVGIPPLDLVIQGEAGLAAHRLWSLGGWSYLHPNVDIVTYWLDFRSRTPFLIRGIEFMRPVSNLEPKYKVTILAREEWTRSPGTPSAVKGLVWYTDGSRTAEGTGAVVYGQSVNRRPSIPLGNHATVF